MPNLGAAHLQRKKDSEMFENIDTSQKWLRVIDQLWRQQDLRRQFEKEKNFPKFTHMKYDALVIDIKGYHDAFVFWAADKLHEYMK